MQKSIKYLFIGLVSLVGLYITTGNSSLFNLQAMQNNEEKQYVILGANDLGMHCMQKDYSDFMILPPANNIRVQVFEKGTNKNRLVTSGIKVIYEMIDNTTSADKINFWDYAKDYGYDVAENIGITGNGLKGEMKLAADQKYFEATAVPVTPYNDNSTVRNPYQLVKVTVEDTKTGKVLATESEIVVPVSDELSCNVCHGDVDTGLNILKAHDERSDTQLVKALSENKRYKCADCHEDPAIGAKGQEGVPTLSEAMHGFHASKMEKSPIQDPTCYSCHPGTETQCYRGIMKAEGVSCIDAKCHGDMEQVASSQLAGRVPWVQEPNCQACHDSKYSTNQDTLYRNSLLNNGPNSEMNNKILCISCHNSPHAEWKSELALDNKLPEAVQGKASYIKKCSVCHTNQKQGKVHQEK